MQTPDVKQSGKTAPPVDSQGVTGLTTLNTQSDYRSQMEYHLVLSALDCVIRGQGNWLGQVTCWFDASEILTPHLRELYEAIVAIQQKGIPACPAELLQRLPATGASFGSRIADLAGLYHDRTAQGGHIVFYAQRVHREHQRVQALEEVGEAAQDLRREPDPAVALGELPKIASKYAPAAEHRAESNSAVLQDLLDDLEGKSQTNFVKFGLPGLDNHLRGLPPCSLTVVSAATGGGKSVLLAQAALYCARKLGKRVLFYTFEMSQREVYSRWASALSQTPHPDKGGDRRKWIGGVSSVQNLIEQGGSAMLNVCTGARTVEQIRSEAIAQTAVSDVGLVVVDYLQLVTDSPNMKGHNREAYVAHVAKQLKGLASQAGIPVLTASQVNKSGGTRESSEIENSSNILIHLRANPSDSYKDTARMDVRVDKFRDGGRAVIPATWHKPVFTIRDKEDDSGF